MEKHAKSCQLHVLLNMHLNKGSVAVEQNQGNFSNSFSNALTVIPHQLYMLQSIKYSVTKENCIMCDYCKHSNSLYMTFIMQ